ncbi:MAG: glutamine--tRNA ligase/YqeY domain fusion protein [Microscillaceae bacterium]|nr:glutamine--tRNA ligase/YqeY domain fusion protein [Microscillaceae bacterium]
MSTTPETKDKESLNFIEHIVEEDIKNNKHEGRIHTRFPPEPNGFLHIGHASSICLNFGIAQKYNGKCNLRFDDTNPDTEDSVYVESIKADVKWLGFDWEDREFYASDYYDQLYEFALQLVKEGKAYVDDLSKEEFDKIKGSITVPGKESPYRNRSVEENLELLERMKNGEFKEGEKVLRAKIDMSSPNMHLRDPAMYRIKYAEHHRTGNKWCIYPTYDFAHGQSDSMEGITHSLCTLEFELHRPLYEWFIKELNIFPSRQIEFARRNLSYTVTSKRKLLQLVEEGHVDGWDDPRMPTISGLRRRGYTPESIRMFVDKIGIARRDNLIDPSLLEFSLRDHLNKIAPRVMAVLDPIKVIITNYPEGKSEELLTENNPEDESMGNRIVPFSKELYIEREDFMEQASKKFFRLAPGKMVRLKSAYIIQCDDFVKDPETGMITELHCSYFPNSKSGQDTSGLKVKGTIHWVSAAQAVDAEVRLYDRLFMVENPSKDKDRDFKEFINPDSLIILQNCKLEPSLKNAQPGERFQFQRMGYFCVDTKNTTQEKLVFNRSVTLKDSWAKEQQK